MYLLCRRCSVQTPGWDVGAQARYKPTQPAQPAQPPLRLLLDATGPQLIPELHPELIPKSDDAAHQTLATRSGRLAPHRQELRLLLDN